MSTIFALASGAGKCGVSIVRISGPRCKDIYEALSGKSASSLRPRLLHRISIASSSPSSATKELIDTGMAVFFPNPKSFTGEDVLELHLHGASSVIKAVYAELSALSARIARPGEFSERAFHAGKLGVRELEGMADLLSSETAAQRKQALWLLNGGGNELIMTWRATLIECLAAVEAFIDFSEDENIESHVLDAVLSQVARLCRELSEQLSNKSGERTREGYNVVISGRPNAGKSSLFNLLVGRNAAIVSPIAGTTRDVLQVSVEINGLPVIIHDTAGLRENVLDAVEAEGVSRAHAAVRCADLIINVLDPSDPAPQLYPENENVINIFNKNDQYSPDRSFPSVSCKTKDGIAALMDIVHARLQPAAAPQMAVITRERHRHLVTSCHDSLVRMLRESDVVLQAEYLRRALQDCGRVSGHVDTEEVLDALFKTFCIGK